MVTCWADTNPIRQRRDRDARITLEHYDLSDNDLEETFMVGEFVGLGPAKLKDILRVMKATYFGKIGVEYMHSNNTDVRRWMRQEIEPQFQNIDLPIEKKKEFLKNLIKPLYLRTFFKRNMLGKSASP